MARKQFNQFYDSATLNTITYNDIYNRAKMLATSLFEWVNVPKSVNTRFLENSLYERGMACIYNHSDYGIIALDVVLGQRNFNNEPVTFQVRGANGSISESATTSDCVLIRNNEMMLSTSATVQLFAYRLYECTRAIDVNINAQKTPVIGTCHPDLRRSLENKMMQYDGNQPFIIQTTKVEDELNLKSLDLGVDFVADKLHNQKINIQNEMLAFFGINTANTEKRERMITDEVSANNEMIEFSAEIFLLSRKQACEQINELFGTNIDVRIRDLSKFNWSVERKAKLTEAENVKETNESEGNSDDKKDGSISIA